MIKRRPVLRVGPSVGLEITSTALRAVEVNIQPREIMIQRTAQVETPEACLRNGKVIDPAALADGLRRLWEKAAFCSRRCVVAMPPQVLMQRMLTVPPAPPAEQRLIVRSELERYAPVRDDSHFGWMSMTSGGGPGGNMLAFLANDGVISAYQQALAAANLVAEAYEPGATAVLRTLELGQTFQEPTAAVYVTDGCSEMAFLEAGRTRYYRRLDAGLGVLADVLPGTSEEDPELARFLAVREAPGLPGVPERGELNPLVLEVKRSLQYYGRAYSDAPQPQRVLILGDCPPLEQFVPILREELNLEVSHLHPVRGYPQVPGIMDDYMAGTDSQFLVSLGVALRPLSTVHGGATLDLRSGNEAQILARHAPRYLMVSLAGSILVLVGSLAATLLLDGRLNNARNELKAATAQVQTATAEHAAVVTRSMQLQTEVDRLRMQALPVPQLLARVGTMMPAQMALTFLELKEDGSMVLDGDARTPQHVNRLLQQLSYNPQFRAPNLESMDADRQLGTTRFRVQTGLEGYTRDVKKDSA